MELKRDNFFVELYILYFDSYPNNLCQFVQKLFWVTLSLLFMPLVLLLVLGFISYNKIKGYYWYNNLDSFKVFYYIGLILMICYIPILINYSTEKEISYNLFEIFISITILQLIVPIILTLVALIFIKIISKIDEMREMRSKSEKSSKEPSFWKIIFLYLKAKKEKICPLIKIT